MTDVSTIREEIVDLLVSTIVPNPFQPREHFDEAALRELADSIKEKGVLQPVVVRAGDGGNGTYELVLGERRLRACQLLGRETIPAIVRQISSDESREIALIENLQRDDLTVMEEARSLKALSDRYDGDNRLIAEKIGKGLPYVMDRLSLLTLPAPVQAYLDEGKINVAQAKVILDIEGEEQKIKAAERAIKLNLTANELRGRMQHLMKEGEGGEKAGTSSKGGVTYNQISTLLVRLYDAVDGFEFAKLGDTNKRETLKKQMGLIHRSLGEALQRFDEAVQEPAEA